MNAILKISIVTLCLGLASSSTLQQWEHAPMLARNADLNLMQFIMQSRAAPQSSASHSLECFDYYIPLLNSITLQYEKDYSNCLSKSDAAVTKVDEATEPERKQIESTAQSSCELLETCAGKQSSVEYFECFVNAGSENSKTMYTISVDASDVLAEVIEQYRLIQNDEYRCTNASERVYVENTAAAYADMDSCLKGLSDVPAPEPGTEEPATEEPATEEPAPEEPATEEPATEEPATEEPATEEPETEEDPNELPNDEAPVRRFRPKFSN